MVSRTVTVNVVGDSSGARKPLTDLAATSESSASRISGAFQGTLSTLNRTDLFGPLGASLATVAGSFDGLLTRGNSLAATLGKIGVAGIGASLGLYALAQGDIAASRSLKTSLEGFGAGDVYEDFEKLSKGASDVAFNAKDAATGLSRYAAATEDADPEHAAKFLKAAEGLANLKFHGDLERGADAMIKIETGGRGADRILKSLHITTQTMSKSTAELTAAQKKQTEAQAHWNTLEDSIHIKKRRTIVDNDHEREAKRKLAEANADLKKAQDDVAKSSGLMDEVLQRTAGHEQDRATWMNKIKTKGENAVGEFGAHWAMPLLGGFAALQIGSALGRGVKGIRGLRAGRVATKEAADAARVAEGIGGGRAGGATRIVSAFGRQTEEAIPKLGGALTKAGGGARFLASGFGLADAAALPFLGTALLVVAAVGSIAFAGYELYKHWDSFWNGIKVITADAVNGIIGMVNKVIDVTHVLSFGLLPDKHISRVGWGDLGAAKLGPAAMAYAHGAGGGSTTVHTHINLDGREIGKHVATHTRDQLLEQGRNTTNIGLS